MTIPNFITIARLIMVPLVVFMIGQGNWMAAFALFIAAGVSDGIDGFLAKRFDMASELGAYLDPLADKALIVAIYVTLGIGGVIPAWVAILVVSRDIMIVSAVILSWLMENPITISPIIVSKLNTAAQIGFAAMVLGGQAFAMPMAEAMLVAKVLVAALTLASMAAYLTLWLRHMAA